MLHKFDLKTFLFSRNWLPVRDFYHSENLGDDWANAVYRVFFDHECPSWSQTIQSDPKELEDLLNLVPIFFERSMPPCMSISQKHPDTPLTPAIRALQKLPRTGWTRVIPAFNPKSETAYLVESVAAHSYKTAVLAAALNPSDPEVAFEMGLCHDMAESVIGDLTPQQAPNRTEKHRIEKEAFQKLVDPLPHPIKARMSARFLAYQENTSPTAHLVHIADKLDMALQALHYEKLFHLDLQEFLDSAHTDILQKWKALAAHSQ